MRELKILELNLRNFKGVKDLKLQPNGNDLFIYGENASGKTTVMDSFLWLLFDKDSNNSSNFNIKTLDNLGNPIHMLEHEVNAKLEVDGKVIELQKIYKEKWTKKRGQADAELTGHTTDYFINGVPKKLSEYKDYLSQIIDEDTFKILTNPLYFNRSLDWKKRRSIAMDICGDLSYQEVIDHDNKLFNLRNLLSDKSIDEIKSEMKARRLKLNEELKSIPYRIDELSREQIDISNIAQLTKDRLKLKIKLDEVNNPESIDFSLRLRTINNNKSLLQTELKQIEQSLAHELRKELEKQYKIKTKLDESLMDINVKLSKVSSKIEILEDKKEQHKKTIEDARNEFKTIAAQEFPEDATICPTCKQSLPVDEVENHRNKFEADKKSGLELINENGKKVKHQLEQCDYELSELYSEKEKLNELGFKTSRDLNAIEIEIKGMRNQIENINPTSSPDYREIIIKITNLETEEKEVMELQKNQGNNSIVVKDLQEQIDNIDKQLAKVELVKDNEKRVEELKSRERQLANYIAEIEKTEFLCEQFIITKSNLLEDKLNSHFRVVKFKLFNFLVNGGIDPTFVTTVDGVPFEDLNNAMKINAGLDIINSLTDYYDFKAPIFIDNRESVNEIIEVNSQVINLIVSKDKELRVEVEQC